MTLGEEHHQTVNGRVFSLTVNTQCDRPPNVNWDPTTSFLTTTTLIYAIGAGITAGAGTRLVLQLILVKGFKLYSLQLRTHISAIVLLFFVTTSPNWDWVICAPAAFLGCGRRLSGVLSGTEPWFPVTRYNHGRRITYHRKLIRQLLEGYVASARLCDQLTVIQSHHQ